MTLVVAVSWDPDAGVLEYVPVNGGRGGAVASVTVDEEPDPELSARLAGSALPLIADVIIEEGVGLIIDIGEHAVLRCAVKAIGGPGHRAFRLKPPGSAKDIEIPAGELGIEDSLADRAQRLKFLYAPWLTPPGCWLVENAVSFDAWLEAQQRDIRELRQQREQAEYRRRMDARFINPYTFVPFVTEIERRAPAGHLLLGKDRLSGAFTVTWTFASPFQVPEGASRDGEVRLPGSSVKGTVRSVHEALAGGCMRVFDADFIPSYRDTPQPDQPGSSERSDSSAGRSLAVVSSATEDGQALAVQLCDEHVWVRADQLRRACGPQLATGSRVTLDEDSIPAEPNGLGRKEYPDNAGIRKGGDWVVLVTAAGTRTEVTKSGRDAGYFLACGKMGAEVVEVPEPAWRAFVKAVAGADDLRRKVRQARDSQEQQRGSQGSARQPTAPVYFKKEKELVGRRRVVTGRLWPGDVIWIRVRHRDSVSTSEEISLAAVWRHPGWDTREDSQAALERWSARRRVPPSLLPCSDPVLLCPTCRVLGSVDPDPRDRDGQAEQRAYAGHVRFGDAVSTGPVPLEQIRRAPVGAPRPGAGQFYLACEDTSPADRGGKPTREWGSAPDARQRRQLRGRKFYWHADPELQPLPRHKARDYQRNSEQVQDRQLAPPGTQLTQRITFDNLSPAEAGGLLAALDPARVLPAAPGDDGRLLMHLGGGKPLGLGSCTAAVSDLRAWNAASRYGGEPEQPADPDAWVRAFAESCPAPVRETWPSLAAVLAASRADAAYVWYPPGKHWSEQRADPKRFDEPFHFFTASSGMFLATASGPGQAGKGKSGLGKSAREMIPLPPPTAPDQSLPIIGKDDL